MDRDERLATWERDGFIAVRGMVSPSEGAA